VGDRPGEQIAVLFNDSDPQIGATVLSEPDLYPAGGQVYDVALGDLNADGALDVVAAVLSANQLAVRFGNADGTFGEPTTVDLSDEPERVDIAHVNDDEHPDLAIVVPDAGGGFLALNDGDGGFGELIPLLGAPGATHIATGDLDGDGDTDAAVTETDSDVVLIYVNEGGAFSAEVANLSRNVVIRSADDADFKQRGHTMYHRFSRGSISYARFDQLDDVVGLVGQGQRDDHGPGGHRVEPDGFEEGGEPLAGREPVEQEEGVLLAH